MKVETRGRVKFDLKQEDKAGDLYLLTIWIDASLNEIRLWLNKKEVKKLKEL